MVHVRNLVELGPRPPGSPPIEASRVYIAKQLEQFGWRVTRQTFTADTPRGPMEFVNLISEFGSPTEEIKPESLFLLCSHYDTKLFQDVRFVGANDGASGNAVLLELARVFSQRPRLAKHLVLVFFDGEEAYENFSETDGLYGSRHFAERLVAEDKTKRFRGGMVFDMVGDRSLTITLPPDSPSHIAQEIFASADALNLRKYFTYFDHDITDDHTPLNAVGIPTIDLIDFDYDWWHTTGDTLDKVSPESLQIVGSVAAHYLSGTALE